MTPRLRWAWKKPSEWPDEGHAGDWFKEALLTWIDWYHSVNWDDESLYQTSGASWLMLDAIKRGAPRHSSISLFSQALGSVERLAFDASTFVELMKAHERLCKCPVCGRVVGKTISRLVPDHNHATLLRRSGLCDDCNLGRAPICENPNVMRDRAEYMEWWDLAHWLGFGRRPFYSGCANVVPFRGRDVQLRLW